MSGFTSIYITVLFLTVVLGLGLAGIVWHRSDVPGRRAFAGLMLAGAWWAFFNGIEALAWDQPTEVWISKIQYFGKEAVPVFFLLFVVEYTRLVKPLSPGALAGLWVIPLLTVGVAFTNELHGLMWSSIYPKPGMPPGFYTYEHGTWFWAAYLYNNALLLTASLLLVYFALRTMKIYRRQALALLAGVLVSWVANGLYVAGFFPKSMDITPIAAALTGLIFVWGIFGLRLFDLIPAARSTLIEEMHDGMLVLDMEERVVDLNPAVGDLIGIGADAIGKKAALVFPAWRELCLDGQEKALRCRENSPLRQEITLEGLPQRWLDVHILALHNRQQRLNGWLLVLRDITEYKQMEKLRDDLMHTVVHDLRNPLSNILMVLETADQMEDKSLVPMYKMAHTSAMNMLSLVNSILDVARLQRGQVQLELALVDVVFLAGEALREQLPHAEGKGIQLESEFSPNLPFVFADPKFVRRILQNLLGNALQFTPAGGVVRLGVRADAGRQALLVSIVDNGPGISPEVRPFLFQMFAGGQARGSGVGLAFCRLAVEAHGGQIWAESTPGQGAAFFFTLPFEHGHNTR